MSNEPNNRHGVPGRRSATEMLFDAAIILGFVSGAGYLVGQAYFFSFLTRLSLRPEFVQVATIQYMWHAFFMFIFVATLTSPVVLVARKPPASFVSAAIGNLPLFVACGLVGWVAINIADPLSKWTILAAAVVLAIAVLHRSYLKKSVAHFVYSGSTFIRAMSVGAVAFMTLLVAFRLGDVHAEKLVEGELYAACSVKLIDNKGNNLLGQGIWMLILIDETAYVVVRKEVPAPEFPVVRMINKSHVGVASIHRIN